MTYNLYFCPDMDDINSCFKIEVEAESADAAEKKLQKDFPNGWMTYYTIVKEENVP